MLSVLWRSLALIRTALIPLALILVAVSPEWLPICLKELGEVFRSTFKGSYFGEGQ